MRVIRSFGKATVLLEADNGQKFFAISAKNNRKPNPNQVSNERLERDSGWLTGNGGIQPWDISGVIEIEGVIYSYGPYLPGVSLSEVLHSDTKSSFRYLLRLAAALEALKTAKRIPPRIITDSVYFTEEGQVLFLPNEMVDRILSTASETDRIAVFERFNHPDLQAKRFSFWLASMSYLILTGTTPFSADTEEELRNRVRTVKPLSPRQIKPEIREDVSNFIMRNLEKGSGSLPDLSEWMSALESWLAHGYIESIAEGEKALILEKAKKQQIKTEQKYRFTKFVYQKGRLVAAIAMVIVLLGSFVGNIIANKLAPPVTVGLTQEEVIKLMYASINIFDHMTLEDCFTGDAGKAEINEATYLFVMTKQMQAYEGTTGYVDAQAWHDNGRPDLKGRAMVFGTINPEIRVDNYDPNAFFVKYERWMINQDEDDLDLENPKPQVSIPFMFEDKLTLVYNEKKDYWAISSKEIISQVPMVP